MSIVGFNFTKISAERKKSVVGTVNINNNITLKDIQETKMGVATKGGIRVSFAFRSEYAPDLAVVQLEGEVMLLVDAKQSDELVGNWAKNRQVHRTVAEPLMNFILDRCNVQALLISKDLNLPSPVPLPKVRVDGPVAGALPKAEEKPEAKEAKATKVKKK
jgi:hypothetical protein